MPIRPNPRRRAPRTRKPAPASATVSRRRPRTTVSSRSDASRALGVLPHVRQCFAGDAKQFGFDVSGGSGPTSEMLRRGTRTPVSAVNWRDNAPSASASGRFSSVDARRLVMDRRASSRLCRAASSARCSAGRAGSRGSMLRQPGLDVQGDGGESLRERVVDVARHPGALVGARVLDRLLGETRPLDRHANLIRDRRQQIQLLAGQPPPSASSRDSSRPAADRRHRAARCAWQRSPSVDAASGDVDGRRQAAAFDDVDVARCQLAASRNKLEAPARSAGHPHRLLEIRRQALHSGVVEVAGGALAQPDPAGFARRADPPCG